MLNAGFANLDYLKSRLLPEAGREGTDWDAALSRLGLSVAGKMQRHCNRTLERGTYQEKYSAATLALTLRAYPVEAMDGISLLAIDETTVDISGTYMVDKAAGLVEFATAPGGTTQKLLISYLGGFWLDDGNDMPDGATPLPDEILEAWVSQCQANAKALNLFNAVSLSEPKGGKQSGELLPEVIDTLRPYRRFAGE